MRLGIRLLCLVLLGHWWHALAMPYSAASVMQVDTTHAHHSNHVESDNTCCDPPTAALGTGTDIEFHQEYSAHTTCGSGGHVCCSLQPTPVLATSLALPLDSSCTQRADAPQWVLQRHAERLFKPPKTELPL